MLRTYLTSSSLPLQQTGFIKTGESKRRRALNSRLKKWLRYKREHIHTICEKKKREKVYFGAWKNQLCFQFNLDTKTIACMRADWPPTRDVAVPAPLAPSRPLLPGLGAHCVPEGDVPPEEGPAGEAGDGAVVDVDRGKVPADQTLVAGGDQGVRGPRGRGLLLLLHHRCRLWGGGGGHGGIFRLHHVHSRFFASSRLTEQ